MLSYLPDCIGSSSRLLSSLRPPWEASLSPPCPLNSAPRPASACLITSVSNPAQPIASAWIPSRPWPLMFRYVHKPPNCLALATLWGCSHTTLWLLEFSPWFDLPPSVSLLLECLASKLYSVFLIPNLLHLIPAESVQTPTLFFHSQLCLPSAPLTAVLALPVHLQLPLCCTRPLESVSEPAPPQRVSSIQQYA